MARYYFAQDGSFGDADDLITIDEDDLTFSPSEWQEIEQASDIDRLSVVEEIIRRNEL